MKDKKSCYFCSWNLDKEGKCVGCGYYPDECDCDSIIQGLSTEEF